jgi:hypothetical protein
MISLDIMHKLSSNKPGKKLILFDRDLSDQTQHKKKILIILKTIITIKGERERERDSVCVKGKIEMNGPAKERAVSLTSNFSRPRSNAVDA